MAALIKANKNKKEPLSLLLSLTLTQTCVSRQAHKTSEWPQYRQRTAPAPFSHPFAKRIFVGKSYTWKKKKCQRLKTFLNWLCEIPCTGTFYSLKCEIWSSRKWNLSSPGKQICNKSFLRCLCKRLCTGTCFNCLQGHLDPEFCYLRLGRLLLAQFLHG